MNRSDWLKRELEAAAAEVRRWPAWMRGKNEIKVKTVTKRGGSAYAKKKSVSA